MKYVIIYLTDTGMERREDKDGIPSLEKFNDSRILSMYSYAVRIYKLYPDNHCVILKGEC